MNSVAINHQHRSEIRSDRRKTVSQLSEIERFQEDWATFILNRFEDDKAAARAFRVTPRTIKNWQKQDVPPRGAHVWRAVRKYGFLPSD